MNQDKDIALRNGTVRKANALIQKSRFSLTTQQQKIVLYLISRISSYDKDFCEYEFDIQQFCRVCGIDANNGKNYIDLKEAIKDISDKSLWITMDDGTETLLRWIEKPYINPNSGIIRIRLDNDMRPFLLQLKRSYTQYELLWTLHFKSKYTIRFYELIKSIHFHDLDPYVREYHIDELRRLLGAERYKRYQHFKENVLIPAVNEINEYSDKNVSYIPIKEGRSYSRIRFTIESKDTIEMLKIRSRLEHEYNVNQISLLDELNDKGLI